MQHSWLRSFAEHHCPMLYWLAGVAIATVGVTLVLWSAIHAAAYALLAVPLLLLAGVAAALAEIVQTIRHHRSDPPRLTVIAVGTVALGLISLPLAAALAFATMWIADCATVMRHFPMYQQVVAGMQRGTIVPSGAWQERDAVRFIADASPGKRVAFQLANATYRQSGVVYDPTGGVMAGDPADPSADDPQHHIGLTTVQACHATLITAYYRCDLWEFDED
jgi:hypothetical protein